MVQVLKPLKIRESDTTSIIYMSGIITKTNASVQKIFENSGIVTTLFLQ